MVSTSQRPNDGDMKHSVAGCEYAGTQVGSDSEMAVLWHHQIEAEHLEYMKNNGVNGTRAWS